MANCQFNYNWILLSYAHTMPYRLIRQSDKKGCVGLLRPSVGGVGPPINPKCSLSSSPSAVLVITSSVRDQADSRLKLGKL